MSSSTNDRLHAPAADPARRASPTPAPVASRPFGGSIGTFLCLHPASPPYNDIDRLPLRDIKQEAALGAWIALRRLGKPVTDDLIAALDAQPRLAALAYKRALIDTLRHHRGRGIVDPLAARRRDLTAARISLDVLIARANRTGLDPTGVLFDAISARDLETVEDDSAAHLWRLWHEGIDGLSVAQTQQVILVLLRIRRMKHQGTIPLSGAVRERLRRLRRSTGLPLRTDLL